MAEENKVATLLSGELSVINLGLEAFARELAANGARVTHVDWSPPAGGNSELADLLSRLGS